MYVHISLQVLDHFTRSQQEDGLGTSTTQGRTPRGRPPWRRAGGRARDGERKEQGVGAEGDLRLPPGGGQDGARHGGPPRGRVPAPGRRQRGGPLRRLRRPLRRRRRRLPPEPPLRQHPGRAGLLGGHHGRDTARLPPHGPQGAQEEEGDRGRRGEAAPWRVDGCYGYTSQRRDPGGGQRGGLPRHCLRGRQGAAAIRGPRAARRARRHREQGRLRHPDARGRASGGRVASDVAGVRGPEAQGAHQLRPRRGHRGRRRRHRVRRPRQRRALEGDVQPGGGGPGQGHEGLPEGGREARRRGRRTGKQGRHRLRRRAHTLKLVC